MMPALVRASGAALTTSWALPTPGKGQWPLHPQTRLKHNRQETHQVIRRAVPPYRLVARATRLERVGAKPFAGVLL